MVVDQYIQDLNNYELRKHVQFHHPTTLRQALAFAGEFESFLGPIDKFNKPRDDQNPYSFQHIQHVDHDKTQNAENELLTQISQMIDTKFRELFNENRPGNRDRRENSGCNEPRCRNVGNECHDNWKNDRVNFNENRRSDRQVNHGRVDRPRGITCFNCHEVGHIITRCPYLRDRPVIYPQARQNLQNRPLNG